MPRAASSRLRARLGFEEHELLPAASGAHPGASIVSSADAECTFPNVAAVGGSCSGSFAGSPPGPAAASIGGSVGRSSGSTFGVYRSFRSLLGTGTARASGRPAPGIVSPPAADELEFVTAVVACHLPTRLRSIPPAP